MTRRSWCRFCDKITDVGMIIDFLVVGSQTEFVQNKYQKQLADK